MDGSGAAMDGQLIVRPMMVEFFDGGRGEPDLSINHIDCYD
jgi:hypothetical protein